MVVFHDDMDLDVGRVKVKRGGGAGGHNGLKSIDQHMGNDYVRVRLGVSKPQTRDEVINWVLSNFSASDKKKLEKTIEGIAKHIPLVVKGDLENFLNKLVLELKD